VPRGRRESRAVSDTKDRIDPFVWRVAIVVVLGSIMSILDTTIVNVALRPSTTGCTVRSRTSSG